MSSSVLQLSIGTINSVNPQQQIVYSGVPNVLPPTQIVQASITSLMGGTGTQSMPLDLDPSKFPTMTIGLAKWASTDVLSGVNQTTTTPISQGNWILPIPAKGFDDVSQISWNEKNLFDELGAMVGSVVNGLVTAGAGILKGAGAGFIAGQIEKNAPSVVNLAKDIGQAQGGVGINPFRTLLLQGPDFKKYSFIWIFVPRNYQETQQLNTMIQTFRAAMTPSFGSGNILWNYPNIFNLSLTAPEDQTLIRFKPAVCTTMGVSRNPDGSGAWFRPSQSGGSHQPTITQLTMSFTEMELWTADTVNGNPNVSVNVNQTPMPTPSIGQTNVPGVNGIAPDGQTNIVPAL